MSEDAPTGYKAPIYQALWKRQTLMAVPKTWGTLYLVVHIYLALAALYRRELVAMAILGGLWMVGHVALVLLTLWESGWDDAALAHLRRRYKGTYHV